MPEKSYPEAIVCPGQTKVFPLQLKKVFVPPFDGYDGYPAEWVPVRIFLTPDQLSEVVRLDIDLTGIIQNWIEDDIEIYREAANE